MNQLQIKPTITLSTGFLHKKGLFGLNVLDFNIVTRIKFAPQCRIDHVKVYVMGIRIATVVSAPPLSGTHIQIGNPQQSIKRRCTLV